MTLDQYLSREGMSDASFAAMIRRAPSSVGRLRKGETLPDWKTVRAIHDATRGEVTANDFLPPISRRRTRTTRARDIGARQ